MSTTLGAQNEWCSRDRHCQRWLKSLNTHIHVCTRKHAKQLQAFYLS